MLAIIVCIGTIITTSSHNSSVPTTRAIKEFAQLIVYSHHPATHIAMTLFPRRKFHNEFGCLLKFSNKFSAHSLIIIIIIINMISIDMFGTFQLGGSDFLAHSNKTILDSVRSLLNFLNFLSQGNSII